MTMRSAPSQLYCDLFSGAVLDGLQQEAISSGRDIGESEELPAEQLPVAEGAENSCVGLRATGTAWGPGALNAPDPIATF